MSAPPTDLAAKPSRSPLLSRAGRRYFARHPWQLGLAVLGVALGVAVVSAIDLANASAGRAFHLSVAAITGRATHQIVGAPEGLDETLVRRLAVDLGVAAVAPVVEGYGAVRRTPGGPSRPLHLLGLDPFSEAPFRPLLSIANNAIPNNAIANNASANRRAGRLASAAGSPLPLRPLLTEEGAVVLAAATARDLGLRPGDRFELEIGGARRPAHLVGVLEAKTSPDATAAADLLLADIGTAQELLGRRGRLDRIDLILPAGKPGAALASQIRSLLPPAARLVPASELGSQTADLARSFLLNLTALSLLALVCGLFLIYSTMTFSVVQRRTLIGTLRALGATRAEVFRLILIEATAIGALGTAAGLACGVALGNVAIRLVTRTLTDLYFVSSVRTVTLSPASLGKAALLGLVATLLAALPPAFEAARADPTAALSRSSLESRLRRRLPAIAGAGIGTIALGLLLLALPGESLLLALCAVFLGILGYALLVPAGLYLAMAAIRRPLGMFGGIGGIGGMAGPLGRLAAAGLSASLSRTAVAAAALTVAISVSTGVGTMIGSFRSTVVHWLDRALQADIYASLPSRGGSFRGGDLSPEVAARAARLPGVLQVATVRRTELDTPQGPVRMVAIGTDAQGLRSFQLRDGDPAEVGPAFLRGEGVMVSEPFAHRTGVRLGALLALPTPAGVRSFRVLGIYYDYASDRGLVTIGRAAYDRLWHDPALSGFSLRLSAGADADAVAAELRRALGGDLLLSIQPTRTLKRVSLEIFDRTFSVTRMLRGIALLVAFVGILSSLLAIQLERTRELGVLRALGLTSLEVWGVVTAQTALLGLTAGLLSLPLGLGMAWVMTSVINRRSFGWTIPLEIEPAVLVQAVLLALLAALLAGVFPAYRMARTEPTEALRAE